MKQTPRCALYRGVRLHGVHHTAKSSTAVCIPLRSQVMNSSQKTPRCASCCGVNNLSSVCFNPKFYKCYFSVMPKIFIQNWYCKSQIVQGIFFTTKVFWKNEVERCSKYENTKNRHFRISLTLLCASHRGVKLCGMQHTAESRSPKFSKNLAVRIKSVKIKIFTSHWVPLEGKSEEILLGVNNSIIKEKIWRNFFLFAITKILTHSRVEFF